MLEFIKNNIMRKYIVFLSFLLINISCNNESTGLSESEINKKVSELVDLMNLDEKVGQMTQIDQRFLDTITDISTYSIGSLLSGYLSAKRSKKIILSGIYFLRGISICLFIFTPPSTINSIIFGASFGILWLSTVPATVGIVAHIFGTRFLGLLYGLVFLSHQIGSFFGAYLGGLFYDMHGSYDYAWYLAIALSIFAGLIHLPIREQAIDRLQKAEA